MCGICGQVSFTTDLSKYESQFYNMKNKLYYIGPDLHGEFFSENDVLMN